jgi:hypothetical protein
LLTELLAGKMRCVCFASGAVKRSSTSRTRLTSDRVTFPTWKADGEKGTTVALKKIADVLKVPLDLIV